jgi:hypothetical protein
MKFINTKNMVKKLKWSTITIGVIAGAIIGTLTHNLLRWIVIGVIAGVIVGAIWKNYKKDQ